MSDSLQTHGLQHTRLACPSLSPGVCSESCPLCRWSHPTISSSMGPFSSCPQWFPESGFFPASRLFAPGGQSIGASASASVLPVNIQGWSALGWTGLLSLLSRGLHPWHEAFAFMVAATCRSGIYSRIKGGAVERLDSGKEYPSPSWLLSIPYWQTVAINKAGIVIFFLLICAGEKRRERALEWELSHWQSANKRAEYKYTF